MDFKRRAAALLDEISAASHHGGMLARPALEALIRLAPDRPYGLSVETGCGRSSLLFSHLSLEHHVFALDDRDQSNSSVQMIIDSRIANRDHLHFHYGPSQVTLPRDLALALNGRKIDWALLDGPHGYPFPELEYWAVYPHLAPGSLLIIDDVQIPSIARLYDFLRADDMFDLLHLEVCGILSTAIFRRNDTPATPELGDHWWDQGFNVRTFPIGPPATPTLRFETPIALSAPGAHRYLARGWNPIERNLGAWSVRERATLRFLVENGDRRCTLELGVWTHTESAGKDVSFSLLSADGFVPLTTVMLDGEQQTLVVDFDTAACSPAGLATIELRLPWTKHAAPDQANFRRYGVFLTSLALWRR
jgi:hypothetical protein